MREKSKWIVDKFPFWIFLCAIACGFYGNPKSVTIMFRADRGRKQLDAKERGAIVALTKGGASISVICRELDISRPTVVYWQRRYEETGDVDRQPGSGRPRKTTPLEDLNIKNAAIAKPITTAQEIAGMFC